MKITHRASYDFQSIYGDENSISSNCNTLTFENCGEDNVEIYVNDTTHSHTGWHLFLQTGSSITIGGHRDCIIQDSYDFVFAGIIPTKQNVNIIRETFSILT